jgi:hypothetical protein
VTLHRAQLSGQKVDGQHRIERAGPRCTSENSFKALGTILIRFNFTVIKVMKNDEREIQNSYRAMKNDDRAMKNDQGAKKNDQILNEK